MNPTTPANSQQALAELQSKQAVAQNPNQILQAQQQSLGVQGARDTVTGLRGAINNTTKLLKQVAPSVMGRTQGSLVTNAQATRQIGNEQAPLNVTLGEQGGQYNEANRSLADLESEAQQRASGIYAGEQDKLSYLQNLYNVLYGREQDAEKARIEELNRQEQIRQFNEQAAQARRAQADANRQFDLSNGGSGGTVSGVSTPGANPATDARERAARIIGGDIRAQAASYKGLLSGASKGDMVAKQTLAYLDQLKPGLKNSYAKILGSNVGQPTAPLSAGNQVKANIATAAKSTPLGVAKNLFGKIIGGGY